MSFINAATVAEKRNKLKAMFPSKNGWKFSVRNEDHIAIRVTVSKGPIALEMFKKDEDSNHRRVENGVELIKRSNTSIHSIETTYPAATAEFLFKVWAIVNEGNHDNSDLMSDYHDVGYYTTVEIGNWEKPYEVVAK